MIWLLKIMISLIISIANSRVHLITHGFLQCRDIWLYYSEFLFRLAEGLVNKLNRIEVWEVYLTLKYKHLSKLITLNSTDYWLDYIDHSGCLNRQLSCIYILKTTNMNPTLKLPVPDNHHRMKFPIVLFNSRNGLFIDMCFKYFA